jgi:hypothetical protein
MIETPDIAMPTTERMGILARDFRARILNYSATGCLLETNSRLEIGTVGTLRLVVDGREVLGDVQVVRCQPIEGAGSLFQVGAKFLWTAAHGPASLPLALHASAVPATAVAG